MEWTQQKLARYIGRVRTVVEFEGITAEELSRVFEGEAMRRLSRIEEIIYSDEMTAEEKVNTIAIAVKLPDFP